jgi:hypothetical protein
VERITYTTGKRDGLPKMKFKPIVLVASLVLALGAGASAQESIGVDVCACQPSSVTFQLNFTALCSENNVEGPGIFDSACLVKPDDTVVDQTPIIVSSVQIQELGGANLAVLDETIYQEDAGYFNGDEISYTSIIERSPDTVTAENIPRGFRVTITGLNAVEATLTNQWIVVYESTCDVFPIVTAGQQIGWSVFGSSPPYSLLTTGSHGKVLTVCIY